MSVRNFLVIEGSVHMVTIDSVKATISNHMRFSIDRGLGAPLECL